MPLSNSVLRRYTPPTCTLQIVDRSSPLSRWSRRSATALSQFELRFDDPRLPEEQRVSIQGDRDQLRALHEAVTTYVQNLLSLSPEQFHTVLSALAPPSLPIPGGDFNSPVDPSSLEEAPNSPDAAVSSTPRALDLSANVQVPLNEPWPLDSDTAANFDSAALLKDSTARSSEKIFLQPGRGLSHKLFLGSLANQETGPVIQLSTLQLFDLETALDEYDADVVVPTLSRSPRFTATPPAWAGIAAVLLLAVGLTTVVQLLNRSGSRQPPATTSANQESSSNDQQSIALQPSPVPGTPTPPLSSLETLPPPLPPLGSTAPTPGPIPSVVVPGTIPAPNNLPSANVPQTTPVPSSPTRANPPGATSVIPIPGITPAEPRQNSPSAIVPGEATAPNTTNAGPRQPAAGISPSSPLPLPSAAIPDPSIQVATPNPELEAALSQANRGASRAPASSDTSRAGQRRDSGFQRQLPSTPTTPNSSKATAFNTIPQVAEVREYFKQRWEPPSSLKQALQYSIILDIDGTIQRIEPLGKAARDYIDRTGMPPIGEDFVSPNQSGQTPRIRVVLAPDGKVQTFLEPD